MEIPGFKKVQLTELNVRVGQQLRTDAQLEVGEITDSVTVTATTAPINTETASLGEVIDNQKIQNLPLNGREFIQLAGLVPGVQSGNPKRGAVYSKGFSVGFNGARSTYNSYYLDGAASTDPYYNQLISSPALDAIKEFRVETNMYSAQYGRSGGGVISVVTNSGTKEFHGALYEYHRNKALDARPFFYTGSKKDQPGYLFNQFGGTVGGPVIKRRTFFFFSAEGFRQKKPGSLMIGFAPTEKERIGDLSESINPWTLKPVVLINPYTQEVIQDSKVPQSLINPVGKKLMDLWPKPNYSGDPFLNWRAFRGGSFNQNKLLIRMDHNLSAKNVLSGTFNFGNYMDTSPANTQYGDMALHQDDRTLVLTYTRNFSTRLVNDLKFNYTRYLHGGDYVLNDKNYAKEWGLWSGTRSVAPGSPRVLLWTVGFQYFTIGGNGADAKNDDHVYISDALAWVKGTHTIFLGGDFMKQNFRWKFNDSTPAAYYFGFLDGDPVNGVVFNGTGSTFSSLLMGISPRTIYSVGDGDYMRLNRNILGLYIQDNWKVMPRLTLNLGLRYDYEAPFVQPDHMFRTLNFKTGLPVYAKGAPADKLALLKFPYETGGPDRAFDPNKLNFAPRFGFAFKPFNNNLTVVRGGYGMFYNSENAYSTAWGAWSVPFRSIFDYRSRGLYWPDRKDHYVPVDQEPFGFNDYAGRDPGWFYTNAPYYPTGYLQHWNLTVSRAVGWKTAVEIGYVRTKGTNLNGHQSLGQFAPETDLKTRRAIPGWSIGVRTKGFNSQYNALQLKANKEFSHGLHFLASFTWGHALAESSQDELNENLIYDTIRDGDVIRPFYGRRYSNADFDVRRRFSFSGGYELPIGRRKALGNDWNKITDSLVGGWQISYILTLQDGYPFSVYDGSLKFPDRICDGKLPTGQRSIDRWFDIECFPTHQPVRIPDPNRPGQTVLVQFNGNSPPMSIVGPGTSNLDLGIHKNVSGKRATPRGSLQRSGRS